MYTGASKNNAFSITDDTEEGIWKEGKPKIAGRFTCMSLTIAERGHSTGEATISDAGKECRNGKK
jgi:hypothetical protein